MTYIILAAGKGSKLSPLTLKYSKQSFLVDEKITILQRLVKNIRDNDQTAEIVVVTGYLFEDIKKELENDNVAIVMNPFFEVTGSLSTLWFARQYLERENVTIIHGDVVFENSLFSKIICRPTDIPLVLLDTSVKKEHAYNVVTNDTKVLVMSKDLNNFNAKYACVTKLDSVSTRLLKYEVDTMIYSGMSDLYFEDALVQMILFKNFELFYKDIAGSLWTEIDTVDDFIKAKVVCAK